MIIGIDASRAFLLKRTGIEEYSYQVIKHLRNELAEERVVLYVRKGEAEDGRWSASWRMEGGRLVQRGHVDPIYSLNDWIYIGNTPMNW